MTRPMEALDPDKFDLDYDIGLWHVKVGKVGGGTVGQRYVGNWNVEVWLAGEKVGDGEMWQGMPSIHAVVAIAAKDFAVSTLEDIGPLGPPLLDYATSFHHVPGHFSGKLLCLTCKGEFRDLAQLKRGECPGPDAVHGDKTCTCDAFKKWQTCRHTYHFCQCLLEFPI